jgi:hypothetical protein
MGGGRLSGKAGARLLALSAIVFGAALALFDTADRAGAADRRMNAHAATSVIVSEMTNVQRVKVIVNKSRTFRVDTAFSTIVAGSPEIIDVKSLSDHLIYIQGKKTGTTNVILFDNELNQIAILDVEVTLDTATLAQNIRASTGTQGIRVSASEGICSRCGCRRTGHGDRHRQRSQGGHRRQRHEPRGAAASDARGPLSRSRPFCRSRFGRQSFCRECKWHQRRQLGCW